MDLTKTVLHVGCGAQALPEWLRGCTEIRLDIDEASNADIVGDMCHLPEGLGPFDAVFSSHSLEHLMPHDIVPCLRGFREVLKPNGAAIVIVPDLEGVSPIDEVLYNLSDGTPICGLDLYYGWRRELKDHPAMAHHFGFVESTLRKVFEAAGFSQVVINRVGGHNLFGVGVK